MLEPNIKFRNNECVLNILIKQLSSKLIKLIKVIKLIAVALIAVALYSAVYNTIIKINSGVG